MLKQAKRVSFCHVPLTLEAVRIFKARHRPAERTDAAARGLAGLAHRS